MIHYKDFVDFLIKYEELNVKKATPDLPQVNILIGDNKVDLKEKLTVTVIDNIWIDIFTRPNQLRIRSSTLRTGFRERSWNCMLC